MDITPKKDMPPMPSQQPDTSAGAGMIIAAIVGSVLAFIFSYGAARLSYNTYGSYGWAFLAFVFSGLYYPYYALFISRPAGFFGGKRHR